MAGRHKKAGGHKFHAVRHGHTRGQKNALHAEEKAVETKVRRDGKKEIAAQREEG